VPESVIVEDENEDRFAEDEDEWPVCSWHEIV
jgi:hypothetical protein